MPEIIDRDRLRGQSREILGQRALQDMLRESLNSQVVESLLAMDVPLDGEDVETISGWLCRYSRAPKDATRPFSFRGQDAEGFYFNYEFQRAILDDPAQKVVVRKSAQMGVSEIMARDCLARLNRHHRTKAIYVLPTKDDVGNFSDTRIRTILEYSPALRRIARDLESGTRSKSKDTDNQSRKQIGDSFLIVRGGWEYRQAQMIDADFLYLDEYERLKENVIPSYENRLSGSKYKLQRAFSTPYLEGKGIDALFQQSDQKFWHDLCHKCGHAQIMGDENIRRAETDTQYVYWYACVKCGAEMTSETRTGEWRSTQKSKSNLSGYQVSQFMSPTMTAEEMVGKRAGGALFVMQDYLNLTLGLPAKGGLQDEEVRHGEIGTHEESQDLVGYDEVVMAIDWGGTNGSWAEISTGMPDGRRLVQWIEGFFHESPTKHIERMQELAARCRATYIVADMGWGQHQNEAMREQFGKRFWTIMTSSGEARFEPGYFPRDQHIIWGKLRCFKSHFHNLSQRLVWLSRNSHPIELGVKTRKAANDVWVEHHKSIIIRTVDDDRRIDVAHGAAAPKEEITSRGGPVHLVAASAYADVMWAFVRNHRSFEERCERRRGSFRVGVARAGRRS